MLEKKIETTVCDYARSKGFTVYKFSSPARAAVPDRMFIRRGQVFFVEFKATGKKPTPAQVREHDRLRASGMSVFVVDSVEMGKLLIDEILGERLFV